MPERAASWACKWSPRKTRSCRISRTRLVETPAASLPSDTLCTSTRASKCSFCTTHSIHCPLDLTSTMSPGCIAWQSDGPSRSRAVVDRFFLFLTILFSAYSWQWSTGNAASEVRNALWTSSSVAVGTAADSALLLRSRRTQFQLWKVLHVAIEVTGARFGVVVEILSDPGFRSK